MNSGDVMRYASRSATSCPLTLARNIDPCSSSPELAHARSSSSVRPNHGGGSTVEHSGPDNAHVDRRALGHHTRPRRPAQHEEDRPELSVAATFIGRVEPRADVLGEAEQPLPRAGIPLATTQTTPRLIGRQNLNRRRLRRRRKARLRGRVRRRGDGRLADRLRRKGNAR